MTATAIMPATRVPSAQRPVDSRLTELAHELRTPLSSVIGLSAVLGRGIHGPLTDKQSEYVTQIESSGRHLLALINTVLDLARADAGKLRANLTEVDVAVVVGECVAIMRDRGLAKGIYVFSGQAFGAPKVLADATRLKQVLLNLLSNAITFTENGQPVGVHARHANGEVSIDVWDCGIGIAAEDLERVFEPFERVDTSLSSDEEGVGLGLSVSRRLTELQGGRLTVRSSTGFGSVFTVTLPAATTIPSWGEPTTEPHPEPLPHTVRRPLDCLRWGAR